MISIENSIQNYIDALADINEYFEVKGHNPPADMTDVWWTLSDNFAFHFDYDEPEDKSDAEQVDFNYSLEVRHKAVIIKKDFTWMNIDDNGNEYPILLDNSKRIHYLT